MCRTNQVASLDEHMRAIHHRLWVSSDTWDSIQNIVQLPQMVNMFRSQSLQVRLVSTAPPPLYCLVVHLMCWA